ncbi:hypothetical protein OC707_02270 ['Opuntia sp.' phytoplasma]|uniref:hypothetical protein n=2 Tax=Candidatus Phytoplasma asiaticum TaxID=2763338 RepID=UPI0027124DAF|nr:hypothetical protein ['Opuntia sp.' phytoplasma]MDO8054256.1 hypothetical protein ['Opuntia sp.' phytoplasma]
MTNVSKKYLFILSIILLFITIVFIYINKNNEHKSDIFLEVSNSNLSEEMNSKLLEQKKESDIQPKDNNFYIDQKINNENNNDISFQKKLNSNFLKERKIDSKTQSSIQKFNSQEEKKYKTNINSDQWEQIQKYFLDLEYDDVSKISFLPSEDLIFIQKEKTKFNIEEKIKQKQESLKKWQKWFNESQRKINNLQKKLNFLPDLKILEDELQKLIKLENQQLYPNNNKPNINPQIKKYDFDTEHQNLQSKIIQITEQKENIYKEIEKEKENQKRFSKMIDEIKENHCKEIQYNIQYIKNNFCIQQL